MLKFLFVSLLASSKKGDMWPWANHGSIKTVGFWFLSAMDCGVYDCDFVLFLLSLWISSDEVLVKY
ncbi:hypothetical protein LguiA_012389 [Lonicera macranthoides]